MASQAARAGRNREVRDRLEASLLRIGKQLNIEIPPEPKRAKDPGLQPIVELERFADFAEAVEGAIFGLAQADEAPAGYESWSMQMLRDEIKSRGITAPARNKAEAVELLEFNDLEQASESDSSDSDEDDSASEDADSEELDLEDPDSDGSEPGNEERFIS